MSEPSKFDPSKFDLSHLHIGEQNRIRKGQLYPRELDLLSRGLDPWTKSGKPKPLPLDPPDIPEPTREQLLARMHVTDRQFCEARDSPATQVDAIFDFHRRQWKEGQKQEQENLQLDLERTSKALDLVRRLQDDPEKAHLLPPANASKEELHKWLDDMSKPVRNIPFPNPDDIRQARIQRQVEDEAEQLRYQRQLAEAREHKLAEFAKQDKPETVHRKAAQPGIEALRDEVNRAGKVMGQASELLWRKTPKPPADVPLSPPDPHNKIVAWVKRNPFWTAAAAFAVWQLPLGIAQLWPVLVRDKTIPEWVAESRWPGMTPHVYGWLSVIFFVTLIILAMIITVSRKGEKSKGDES